MGPASLPEMGDDDEPEPKWHPANARIYTFTCVYNFETYKIIMDSKYGQKRQGYITIEVFQSSISLIPGFESPTRILVPRSDRMAYTWYIPILTFSRAFSQYMATSGFATATYCTEIVMHNGKQEHGIFRIT